MLKFFLPQMFKFFFTSDVRYEKTLRASLRRYLALTAHFHFFVEQLFAHIHFGSKLFASEFKLKSRNSIGCDVWVTSSLTINLLLLLLSTKIFLFDADISCILVFPTFFKEDFFISFQKRLVLNIVFHLTLAFPRSHDSWRNNFQKFKRTKQNLKALKDKRTKKQKHNLETIKNEHKNKKQKEYRSTKKQTN